MANEIGNAFRDGFLEVLKVMGTDCDVRGELRRALKQTKIKEGYVVFKFADEFALDVGDRIIEIATESHFDVIEMQPVSKAGAFHHFAVTTELTA
jgi:hypothetical protein